MTTTVVQYQAKPQHADENQRLIEGVFTELNQRGATGFTYQVFRLDDGVSFVHVVTELETDASDSLVALPAFGAFVAGVSERCDLPPVARGAAVVGDYH